MEERTQCEVKCNSRENASGDVSKTAQFADEIKKTIFQKCHQLADLTGCSVFIKITDPSDKESLYYGTYEYIRDYNEEGLKSEDKDVAVSGSTGLPITTADVCIEPPWNMFMWTVNDNNKLSMISSQNGGDMAADHNGNGMDDLSGRLSDTDSQKTESADEADLIIDEKLDEYDDDEENDPDYEPEGKVRDLSKRKSDATFKKKEDEPSVMTNNSDATASSATTTTTSTSTTLSDREHQNLLSCLPKLDSINTITSAAAVPFKSLAPLAHQGDAGLLPFNMLLEQQMKHFKYAPFSDPGLALSSLANVGFQINNSGIGSNSVADNGLVGDPIERRFHCEVCGKGFSLLGNLKTHRRIHNQEKPFKCETCGKGFTQSGNLRAHERIHTGEKPFCCHVCAKSFVQIQHLKSHMRTHSGERPYQCKHCGKAFTQASTLRAHIRIHSGERPYQCKICCKAFSQSSNLKEHYRVHSKQQLRQQEGFSLVGFPSNNGMENLSPMSNDNADTAMDRGFTDLGKIAGESLL
ncbi:uncharacterized protein [Ptychodera flava]